MATKEFLNIDRNQQEPTSGCSDTLTDRTIHVSTYATSLNKAFNVVSQGIVKQGNRPQSPSEKHSSLLDTMMDGYTKAIKERDEALASLATTSLLKDHNVIQKHTSKQQTGSSRVSVAHQNSDEEMLELCKQLGNEITARTAAEHEVKQLTERLKFEKQLANAKERALLEEIAKYKKALGGE